MLIEDETSDGTYSIDAPSPSNPFGAPISPTGGDGAHFDAFGVGGGGNAAPVSMMPSLQQAQALQMQQQQQQVGGQMTGGGPNQMTTMPPPAADNWPPPPPPPQPQPQPQQFHQQQHEGGNVLPTQSPPTSQQPFLTRVTSCLSIESHQRHFDVDTADVWTRIKGAVLYCTVVDGFRNDVLRGGGAVAAMEAVGNGDGGAGTLSNPGDDATQAPQPPPTSSTGKGPDLYGPAWISMTLAFLIAVTSNASLYFHHTKKDISSEFDYDIDHVLRATSILYAFSFGLPTLLWLVFRVLGVLSLGLVDLVCLYGYSLVPFLPACIVCIAPFHWVAWTALAAAGGASVTLVLKNVTGPILEGDGVGGNKGGPLVMTSSSKLASNPSKVAPKAEVRRTAASSEDEGSA